MKHAIRHVYDVNRTRQTVHIWEGYNVWTEVPGLFKGEPIFQFGQFVLIPLGGGHDTEAIFEWGYFRNIEPATLEIPLFPDVDDQTKFLGFYDDDILVPSIPFYFYVLGTTRELTARLWWNKDHPDAEDLYGLTLSCEPTGATLPEGSEMAQYFIAGTGTPDFIPSGLELGYMDSDSYLDVTIGFQAPVTAESRGQVMLVLTFTADDGPSFIGGSFMGEGANFGWTMSPVERIVNGFDLLIPVYVLHPDDLANVPGEITGVGQIEWRESEDDGVSR